MQDIAKSSLRLTSLPSITSRHRKKKHTTDAEAQDTASIKEADALKLLDVMWVLLSTDAKQHLLHTL